MARILYLFNNPKTIIYVIFNTLTTIYNLIIEQGVYRIDDLDNSIRQNCNIIILFESCMKHNKDGVCVYLLKLGKLPNEDYLNVNPELRKYADKLKNKLGLFNDI